MSWNRPSDAKPAVTNKTPSWTKGALGGLIVVVAAIVAGIVIFSGGEVGKEDARKDRNRMIKESTPAPAPKVESAKKEAPKPKELPPQRVGEVRNGYRLLPNGRMHRVVGVVTCEVARVSLADKVFDEPTDQNIASLMLVQPGDSFLGSSEDYYEGFNKDFLESLKTPIIITQEDSDEVRELKQAVIDARKELKERLDAGEDLTKVMRDSREQMRELGLYREEIEDQVKKIIAERGDLTKQDLNDLVGAANKMLEEYGTEEVHVPLPPSALRLIERNAASAAKEGVKE